MHGNSMCHFFRMSNRYRLNPWVKEMLFILVFGEVSILLFATYLSEKIFKTSYVSMAYLPYVYGGLLCVGGIIWVIAKNLRTRPENLRLTNANIVFKNLNFEKCHCIIENLSETTLYTVSVGWMCKTQLSPVQIHKCGTVQGKNSLSITYHNWHLITNQTPYTGVPNDFCPIIPDTLQVNYRMPNGNLVVHIITKAPRKKGNRINSMNRDFSSSYAEHVLLQRNGKYEKVFQRVCHSQIIESFTITRSV